MKFLAAFALIAVAASASVSRFTPAQINEIQQIVDAIYSPSTDPLTAVALEQMLADLLGAAQAVLPAPSPILVPALPEPTPILGPGFEIIAPGPAPILGPGFEIINPIPELSPIVDPAPGPTPILGPGFEIINPVPQPEIISPMPVVVPSPAPVEQPAPEASAPLVQLIVNVNQA